MKSSITLLVLVVLVLLGSGCTENQRAKSFGGTMNVKLSCGRKLVVATWKEENLWYATRLMRPDENPETTELVEDSSFGVVEGKVIFVECR